MPPDHSPSILFKPAILTPTFNNARTLADILARIERFGLPVIAVDDGSTDRTSEILRQFPSVTVLAHPFNRGKAAALTAGFAAAAKMGVTHVLTIDSDGQHDPDQVPQIVEMARQCPESLILGQRDDCIAGCPLKNRLGKKISNFLVWLESGLAVGDSQCGLRVYPLGLIAAVNCDASRYGFETEILTRAAWQGFSVAQTSVVCHYHIEVGRVTHFRPLLDSLRAIAMHVRLLRQAVPRWPARLAIACHPVSAWRSVRTSPQARDRFAGGLAVGVFFACLPIYGIQGLASLLAARVLRVNRFSALAGSQLSTPPISAILITLSLVVGHLLLRQTWPDAATWQAASISVHPLAVVKKFLLDWTVGGIFLGIVLALPTYWITRAALAAGASTYPATPSN